MKIKIKVSNPYGVSVRYVCPLCDNKYHFAYGTVNDFFHRMLFHIRKHLERALLVGGFEDEAVSSVIKNIIKLIKKQEKLNIPCINRNSKFNFGVIGDKFEFKKELELLKQYKTNTQSILNKNITAEVYNKIREYSNLKLIHKRLINPKVIK